MSVFLLSQLSYYLLVWMHQRRIKNNIMNHLHKQYLKTACYDKHSPFENLLEKNNSVTINQGN